MISAGEDSMKQAKRLFYIILLNIIISAITVGVILQLWERDHPAQSGESTPVVIIVTPTQSELLPIITNNNLSRTALPTDTGVRITATTRVTQDIEMLTYRVKEGDTLGALAVEFNASVADILTVNDLPDPDNLFVGQIIYIPKEPLPKATSTSIPPTIGVSPMTSPAAAGYCPNNGSNALAKHRWLSIPSLVRVCWKTSILFSAARVMVSFHWRDGGLMMAPGMNIYFPS
jgi:LysM repeat protein